MAASRLPILGLIWPDDGLQRPDYELLRGADVAARLGVPPLRLDVAFSEAFARHEPRDLSATGDPSRLQPAARQLVDDGCEAVIWACTSGSFIDGLDWARHQVRALREASGLPASSTTLAFIDALRAMKADVVDLLGPYPQPVTEAFCQCLAHAGVMVKTTTALGTADAPSSFHLDLMKEVTAFAERRPVARPIVLPDTAINTLENVRTLERAVRRPVLTANQVTLWEGLRLLGVRTQGNGPGRLFA